MAPLHFTSVIYASAFILFSFLAYNRTTLFLRRRAFKKQHGCRPPASRYPHKDPVFGLDFIKENITAAKKKKLLEVGEQRFAKYGPTFAANMFRMPVIATIEPENVKAILSLKFKDFSLGNRYRAFGPLLGKGIFVNDGEAWAHSRHMIRPNFARDQVADLQAFERLIQDLFKHIPRDGETVDLQELFFRFTIDSATEFLLGRSVHSLRRAQENGDLEAKFAEAFNYSQYEIATNARLGPFQRFRRNTKAQEYYRIVFEFVDQFVDDAIHYREAHDLEKNPHEEKYVFLHELAKQTKDRKRLRDELLNVLLAGRDTTASLLANLFFVLAQRPDIWRRLRAEVAELGGNVPTYVQLRNMKYLKWCLNESLRIHPVVPGNSRLAIRDTVIPLGGGPDGKSPLFVPAGTLVMYSTWNMHRRRDYFGEDAREFKPERWASLRPSWEYLPFNGGPRICLGQQYALTEAGYVTCRIAQEFERLESRAESPWTESLTLTLCSNGGTKVGLWAAEK